MALGAVLGMLAVEGRHENVARSRRFVAHILLDRPQSDTAILLTSELVANAVVHGPSAGTITIVALEIHGGVRIEVSDSGATGAPVCAERADDPIAEDGRGLFLVDQLADRWDHHRGEAGLTVWFELIGPAFQADPQAESSLVS